MAVGKLWAASEREIQLPFCKTAFVEAGQGFPVVLVHGLMAYSFAWRKNIPALAEHFRVLALDLAGCGRSGSISQGKYGVEAWSRQLEEVLDALELGTVHLLANSAGGAVAIDLATRCPTRVRKIALVSPVNPFSQRVMLQRKIYGCTGLPNFFMNPLVAKAPRILPWLFRHRLYSDPSRITPETIPGYLEGLRVELTVPMLREAICGWKPERMAEQLSHVAAPVLLLWGEDDKIIPPSCIGALLKAFPNASVVRIPHAGHIFQEELPETFNQHVLSFFGSD